MMDIRNKGIADTNIKIAIASGKGGTGKTFVATNLFYLLQQKDYHPILVDCDAEEPNDILFFTGEKTKSSKVTQKIPVIDESKCTFCGKCQEYCNYNAIFFLSQSKIIKVIEDLCHGCGACFVACNDGAIKEKDFSLGRVNNYYLTHDSRIIEARMDTGVYSPVSVIKEAVNQAGNRGIILLDSPPGTSCPFIHTVSAADYVILVTEPTPFGISDLKQSVETLEIMNKKYGVIINRTGLGDNKVYEYLDTENIPVLMKIPFNKSFASEYAMGKIVTEKNQSLGIKFHSMIESIIEEYGNSSN